MKMISPFNASVNRIKPHSPESKELIERYHKEVLSKRVLPIAEIIDKAPWFQSIKRVALLLYRVCQSYKTWSAELGQEWLGQQIGLSRVSVNKAIKHLERVGLIKVFRRDRGLTHTYQFHIPVWVEQLLSNMPRNKHHFKKQVLSELNLSNLDLSSYKEYTEYRDSKEEKIRIFKVSNPEKADELSKKYTTPEIWSNSHRLFKAEDVIAAPAAVREGYMSKIRALCGLIP